jgi:hypothetical protein
MMGNGIEMRTARGVIVSMVSTSFRGRQGLLGEYVTALAIASRLDRDKSLSQKAKRVVSPRHNTPTNAPRRGETPELLGSFEVFDVSWL